MGGPERPPKPPGPRNDYDDDAWAKLRLPAGYPIRRGVYSVCKAPSGDVTNHSARACVPEAQQYCRLSPL
jgi:hypothetical protein